MNELPLAKHGVTFGTADKPLSDWRKNKAVMDEEDPNDEEIETPEDVKAMLGFDPKDESDDDMSTTDTTDKPNPGLRDALLRMHRAAKNVSQLAMFTPGPCISGYGAGHKQRVAKNSGTSEGVRKAWETRHSHKSRLEAARSAGVKAKTAVVRTDQGYKEYTKDGVHHYDKEGFHTKSEPHRYAHEQRFASKNTGTSAGVAKSWLSRQGAMSGAEADAAERQAVLRGRLIRHLNKTKHPKPMPVAKAG